MGRGNDRNGTDPVKVVEELIARGMVLMTSLEPEQAVEVFRQALNEAGTDSGLRASALEAVASGEIELGNNEHASDLLQESLELDPHCGYSKYLSLAQLLPPSEDTLELIESALNIMKRTIVSTMNSDEADKIVKQMAAAHCSAVELLLALAEETQDTNELNRLDQKAEEHILAAMACTSEASIEPYIALANLRLSQARIDDARESMQVVKEHISKNMDQIDLDVRYAAGKQFMELNMSNEAIDVLNSVVQEWDGHAEAWYVLAVAHRSHGDPQNAMDALDRLVHCGDGAPPEDDEGVLCLREEIERDLEEQQSEEEEEKMES